jgi:homoserine O-succinyltransferase
MPVIIQGKSASGDPATARGAVANDGARGNVLDIGLINNMPDAALESAERQFIEVLEAAAGDVTVRLRLVSVPQVPRSQTGREYLQCYSDVEHLWHARPDGIIVTGTEPLAAELRDEPYWGAITQIVDWADANSVSAVWSCLAAHAAVLHLDGVRRHLLDDKRFGVFDCSMAAVHPLLTGAAMPLRVSHSRWNELHEQELAAAGYTILTRSREAGVDTFIRQRNSLFVFFQGHPEYDARALLREYRRDVGRYLRGERDAYPELPHGYVDDVAAVALKAFRTQAELQRRDALLDRFPGALVERRLRPAGNRAAVNIYGNWLRYLVVEKNKSRQPKPCVISQHRPVAATVQRAGRTG